MHHRPAGPASALRAALRDALARGSQRLARRSGRLLALSVVLALAAGTAAALPLGATRGSTTTPSLAAQDAASVRQVPGTAGRPAGSPGSATARVAASTSTAGAGGPAQVRENADVRRHNRRHGDHRRQAPAAVAATAANANCTLVVPADPTTAAGLGTPYQLTATDRGQGACHETNSDQSAFVEAAVFDPARHTVSIYHPLVVDRGDRPAAAPVPVSLPAGAVVGVWFGFNGDTLTLAGPGAGSCVNGLPGSPFGQFAYCNAAAFFAAANGDAAFQAAIPDIGTADDGLPCPTSRDFAVVDQDQSDNLATVYRNVGSRIAQLSPGTRTAGTALTNGSDEGLVAKFIDPALGCTPYTAPDLTNDGAPTAALALNELSAAKWQRSPALIPTSDPMAQVDGRTSTSKTNLYRAGVDQPSLPAGQTPQQYCAAILQIAPGRLAANATALALAKPPAADQPDLLAFLRDRLTTTQENLGCRPAVTSSPADRNGGERTAAGATPAASGAADAAVRAGGAATPSTSTAAGSTAAGSTAAGSTAARSRAGSRATTSTAATSTAAPSTAAPSTSTTTAPATGSATG